MPVVKTRQGWLACPQHGWQNLTVQYVKDEWTVRCLGCPTDKIDGRPTILNNNGSLTPPTQH